MLFEIKLEIIVNKEKACLNAFSRAYSKLVNRKNFRYSPKIRLDYGQGLSNVGLMTMEIDKRKITVIYNDAIDSPNYVIWKTESYVTNVSNLLKAIESNNKSIFIGSSIRISWVPNNLPLVVSCPGAEPVSLKPMTQSLSFRTFRKEEKETVQNALQRVILETISKFSVNKSSFNSKQLI